MGNMFLDIEQPKRKKDEEASVSLKNNMFLSSDPIPQQNIDTSFPAGNSQTFPPSVSNEVVSPITSPVSTLGTPPVIEPTAPIANNSLSDAFKTGDLATQSNLRGYGANVNRVLAESPLGQFQEIAREKIANPLREAFGFDPIDTDKVNEDFSKRLEFESAEIQNEIQQLGWQPKFESIDEVKNFGDFLQWGFSHTARSGMPMLVSIATMGTMSPLILAGEVDSGIKDIDGLSNNKRAALATGGGLIAGTLENLGLGLLIKGMPKELIGKLGGQWFVNQINKTVGRRVLSATVFGASTEALTEGGQEGVIMGAEALAGKEFQPGEVLSRFKESLAAGGFMGGSIRSSVQATKEGGGKIAEIRENQKLNKIADDLVVQRSAINQLETNTYSTDAPNVSISALSPVGNIDNSPSLNISQNKDNLFTPGDNFAQPKVNKTSPQSPTEAGQTFPKIPETLRKPEVKPKKPEIPGQMKLKNPQDIREGFEGKIILGRETTEPPKKIFTPNKEMQVEIKTKIVKVNELFEATGQFQPRDRKNLKESEIQIQAIASKLNPPELMDSPLTNTGSPIVSRSGMVMSGNGRVAALKKVISEDPNKFAEYQQQMNEQYNVQLEPDEIIIRELNEDMTIEQLAEFADFSNRDTIAQMSATERAQRDSNVMSENVVNLFRGGEITDNQNQGFVKAFTEQVVASNEQGALTRDGKLSKEGVSRMENAILALAYEDTDALAQMIDSTDDNIKNITKSLLNVAPKFAKFKSKSVQGQRIEKFEISNNLTEAALKISNLRKQNIKLEDYFNQTDILDTTPQLTKNIMRSFYDDNLKRALSQKRITEILDLYIEEVNLKKPGDMFEDTTTPEQALQTAIKSKKQPTLFGEPDGQKADRSERSTGSVGKSIDAVSKQKQGRSVKKTSQGNVGTKFDEKLNNETVRVEDKQEDYFRAKSTKRQSAFNQAFAAMGIDPEVAVNMKPRVMAKKLSSLVQTEFNLTFVEVGENNTYEGSQTLLDLYRNLHFMSNALGIDNKSIGLPNLNQEGGTFGLVLPSRAKYHGAYFPFGTDTARQTQSDLGKKIEGRGISSPGRDNSFAHEWGHALDVWLMDNFASEKAGIKSSGLDTMIRRIKNRTTKEMLADKAVMPTSIEEALADLVSGIFKAEGEVQLKRMSVENEIARLKLKTKDPANPPKRIKILEDELVRLDAGSSRKKISVSEYVKNSEKFGIAHNKKTYYIDPAELMARSFEAYIGHKVELMEGGSTEILSSTDALYTKENKGNVLDQFETIYPKMGERDAIFIAYNNLFEQMQIDNRLPSQNLAELPPDIYTDDAKESAKSEQEGFKNIPKKGRKSFVGAMKSLAKSQSRAWNIAKQQAKKIAERPKKFAGRSKWEITKIMAADYFFSPIISTKKGIVFGLAARYKNQYEVSQVIEEIISLTMTDFGGTRITGKDGTFEEATKEKTRTESDKFAKIISKHNLEELSDQESETLRLLLTSDEKTIKNFVSLPKNITNAAYDIRQKILKPMFTYLKAANVDIDYYADAGYMPRILDTVLVFGEENKFLYGGGKPNRGAVPLFRNVIFEQDFGYDTETDVDVMMAVINKGSEGKINQELGGETKQAIRDFKELKKELDKLKEEVDGETEAVDDNSEAIDMIELQMQEMYAEIHAEVKNVFGEVLGHEWLARLNTNEVTDFSSLGVEGTFDKARKLPAEADGYMADFYTDPVESLMQYIPQVVRKAEFTRRFGQHRVPPGKLKRKNSVEGGIAGSSRNYLDYLLEIKLGDKARGQIEKDDINQLRFEIEGVLNINRVVKDQFLKKTLAYTHMLGSMSLLPRATLSSIAEPITIGSQTGRPLTDGLKNIFGAVQEGIAVTKKGRELKLYKQQLARILGVVDSPENGEMVANRLGGTFQDDPKMAAKMGRFFVRTLLTGVTNAQRRSSMRIGFQFLAELSNEYINPVNSTAKKRAGDILSFDYGIQKEDLAEFTEHMIKSLDNDFNMPNSWDLINKDGNVSPIGRMTQIAIVRFVDMAIQDPKVADKPRYAEHPVGRVVYGIQSFSRSFTRNVIYYNFKNMNRDFGYNKEARSKGEITAIRSKLRQLSILSRSSGTLFSIYLGHTIVSTIREALMNPDKWEEEEKNGTLAEYVLKLGITRSGMTGGLDPLFNAVTSLKYQRDFANVAIGAAPSYFLNALETIIKAGVTNSPNTLSSEYQVVNAFYKAVIVPLVVLGASADGIAPVLGKALGLSAAVISSPGFRKYINQVILKQVYGEGYERGGKKSDSNELPF